jgi:hypothetical protein
VTTVLIIGSGPAAAGAALALSRRENVAVTVIDIGVRLDAESRQVVERLASSEPAQWETSLVERVSAQPVSSGLRGVPGEANVRFTDALPAGLISIAHPVPVPPRDLITAFAAREGRNCHYVKIPWKPVYGLLRAAESVGLHLPFRADSLLALVRGAPRVANGDMLAGLGVTLHAFGSAQS